MIGLIETDRGSDIGRQGRKGMMCFNDDPNFVHGT